MKTLLTLSVLLSSLSLAACGGDSCDKLTKDICNKNDKACKEWVKKDLLEGSMDKTTCDFLMEQSDYKEWVELAKGSYLRSGE